EVGGNTGHERVANRALAPSKRARISIPSADQTIVPVRCVAIRRISGTAVVVGGAQSARDGGHRGIGLVDVIRADPLGRDEKCNQHDQRVLSYTSFYVR